ncbi:hypothetical protein HH800_12495 [Sphingobium yanoikuyae]|uniref:Uncharacterized protein n=1 Tax=Sphingobium yanoikuyae TaxID=13690 RepID=A0A6M4G7I6_SPHYA|nr:hypothetical protein [Sphingobium yanoikuyae]QJR02920.1 hypothetical protein HH800_12495 [Sphingobium yanoikuyae]
MMSKAIQAGDAKGAKMIATLLEHLARIRARKVELGIVDSPERTEAMRNSGLRRTARKRAALARIDERALAVGVVPLNSRF